MIRQNLDINKQIDRDRKNNYMQEFVENHKQQQNITHQKKQFIHEIQVINTKNNSITNSVHNQSLQNTGNNYRQAENVKKELFSNQFYLGLVVFIELNLDLFQQDSSYIKKRCYPLMADYICFGNMGLIQKFFQKTQWRKKKIISYLKKLKKDHQLTNQLIQIQKYKYKKFMQKRNCLQQVLLIQKKELYQKRKKQFNQFRQIFIKPDLSQTINLADKEIINNQTIQLKGNYQKTIFLIQEVQNSKILQEYHFKNITLNMFEFLQLEDECVQFSQDSNQCKNYEQNIKKLSFGSLKLFQKCVSQKDQEEQTQPEQQNIEDCDKLDKTKKNLQNYTYDQQLVFTVLLMKYLPDLQQNNENKQKGIFNEFRIYLSLRNSESNMKHYNNLCKRWNTKKVKQIIIKQIEHHKFTQAQLANMKDKIQKLSVKNILLEQSCLNEINENKIQINYEFQQCIYDIALNKQCIDLQFDNNKVISKYLQV